MKILSFLIYIPLQIAFIPISLIGLIITGYKQLVVSKRLGTSQTAIEILNGRWILHVFNMRADDAAVKLANVVPNTSTFGLWLTLLPLWLKYKICGEYFAFPVPPTPGTEGISELVSARCVYFDSIIERHSSSTEQLVVLGAGYDTRAYEPTLKQTLAMFELDEPRTQSLKLDALTKAGIEKSHVTFLEVNFEEEHWHDKLVSSSYDASKPTIFLWEGVSLYLSENDVRAMFKTFKEKSAPNSVLIADFYGDRFTQFANKRGTSKTLDMTDEAITFGLPLEENPHNVLEQFITSEDLTLGEAHFLGDKTPKGAYAVVAEILL